MCFFSVCSRGRGIPRGILLKALGLSGQVMGHKKDVGYKIPHFQKFQT